jgi:DNA-binding NarL/FixJ family response regulator
MILTPRETQILTCMARGYTAKDIARELKMSHRTVETHSKALRASLRARNIPHAVAIAIMLGIIQFTTKGSDYGETDSNQR